MKLTKFNPANHLQNEDDYIEYLDMAFRENDPKLIAVAIGDVAKAKSMNTVAKETGLNRESLYKALSYNGNPTLSTLINVLSYLDIKLKPINIKSA